jgi:TM2 domain-containing membrane protein YozV
MECQSKSRITAGLSGLFLGGFGVHRFYLGQYGLGIAQVVVTCLTCGAGALWGFVEGILLLTGTIRTDAQGRPLQWSCRRDAPLPLSRSSTFLIGLECGFYISIPLLAMAGLFFAASLSNPKQGEFSVIGILMLMVSVLILLSGLEALVYRACPVGFVLIGIYATSIAMLILPPLLILAFDWIAHGGELSGGLGLGLGIFKIGFWFIILFNAYYLMSLGLVAFKVRRRLKRAHPVEQMPSP